MTMFAGLDLIDKKRWRSIMRKIALVVLACAAATLATSGSVQVVSVTQAPKVTGLEGADLFRARKVLKRFFATEKRPECYRVLFSIFEGNLAVEFVPKRPDPVRYEGEPDDPNELVPCGRNVGYVLDKRGNVLRNIYSR